MRKSSLTTCLAFLAIGLLLTACAPVDPTAAPVQAPAAATATPPPAPTAAPIATPTQLALAPTQTAAPTPTRAAATSTLAPTAAPASLSLDALKNAEYPSELAPEGKVELTNGAFEVAAAPGSASKITIKLVDQWSTGDLNGDGVADAAVILAGNGGGSGTFYTLIAVVNDAGKPMPAAVAELGDRIQVKSVAIAGGEIAVDMVTHGPKDPLCCPTQAVVQKYRLQAGKLVASATPAPTAGQGAYSDPFAYCAAVVTIDAPDARYTGAKMPAGVAAGLMQAMELPAGTPPPPITQNSFWRCMAGKVYACTVGANLPCQEKGSADRTPTAAMKDYCLANANSDFIPMVVTGRATVFAWRCKDGAPLVDKQVTQVDDRGFLANIWYQINP